MDECSYETHKILVLVTADPKTAMLIRRAKRVGDFLDAECFAVAVQPSGDLSGLPEPDRDAIERHLNFARNLHIETRILEGEDAALVVVDFARRNQITQIFVTRPRASLWLPVLSHDPVQRIISLVKDIQIRHRLGQGACKALRPYRALVLYVEVVVKSSVCQKCADSLAASMLERLRIVIWPCDTGHDVVHEFTNSRSTILIRTRWRRSSRRTVVNATINASIPDR